jgi:hypothetical protein
MMVDGFGSALRTAHRDAVAGNAVATDPLWQASCVAFNIQVLLPPEVRAGLAEVQEALLECEPTLLRCPVETLHISVIPILAVRVDYHADKHELWRENGATWLKVVDTVARSTSPIEIAYRDVVATDVAVVVVAGPADRLNGFRGALADALTLPAESPPVPSLVHTTIFRYGGPLRDPARFLAAIDKFRLDLPLRITELAVTQEIVYPSLESGTLAITPLGEHIDTSAD